MIHHSCHDSESWHEYIRIYMTPRYLNKAFDWKLAEIAEYYDELPLWSAPFGLMLLEKIPLKPGINVLDIGFGTGFPLIEIAQRLGSSSSVYGIDPWQAASERAKRKLNAYKVENVKIVDHDAAQIPFENDFFDLVTANLVINNLEEPDTVLREVYRVLKPGGKFSATTNLVGHMKEFYDVFETSLSELKMDYCFPALKENIEHRLTVDSVCKRLERTGFKKITSFEDSFSMRFLNGSALLNHSFVILGFMDGWKNVVPDKDKEKFFTRLEENLNSYAEKKGELKLTIPMAYIETEK